MISYAFIRRNTLRAGLLAAALSYVPLSHAFSTMNPPLGWTPGGGPGGSMPGSAIGAGGSWSAPGSLAAGGRAASIPASGRLAAGAARAAAAAVFAHPGVRAAAAIAGWIGLAGFIWDATRGAWVDPSGDGSPKSDGSLYFVSGDPAGSLFPTYQQACERGINMAKASTSGGYTVVQTFCSVNGVGYKRVNQNGETYNIGSFSISSVTGDCPAGWYHTPAGCLQTPPPKVLTQDDFVDGVTKTPMPDAVPPALPHSLPVDLPSIQPTFLPTGNPVPNPDYDSSKPQTGANQPFLQPGVRVTGAPTTQNPWQVDVQPVNRPVASGEPNPDAVPETEGSKDNDKPKEKESQDFCEKNPDVLACMKVEKPDFDTPEEGELPKKTENVTLDDADFFGSGSCPADARMNIRGGQSITVWDWSETCNAARNYVQPVFLVAGAFAALMIVLGGTRSS